MRGLVFLVLAGCGFEVHTGAQSSDATTRDTSMLDDAAIDVAIDAPVTAVMVDVPCVGDVYLRTTLSPDENTNDRPYVIVDGNTYVAPGLFRFDLSAIPSSAQITSAEITLTLEGTGGAPMQIYQLLESWDEETVTSNRRRFASGMSTPWTGAGATPPSRGTTQIGLLSPTGTGIAVSATIETAVVQSWVASPATNYGVLLGTNDDDGAQFSSRETAVPSSRPFMRITYIP